MLPTQTIAALVPIIFLLICLSIPIIRQLDAQVIRLRRPEDRSPFAFLRPALTGNGPNNNANEPLGMPATGATGVAAATTPRPAASSAPKNERPPPIIRNRRPPKAGNLIVRFDPDHEIQRLEYVMRDGRLATIYSRHRPVQQQQPTPPPPSPPPNGNAEPQVQARQQHSLAWPAPDGPNLPAAPVPLGQPSEVGQSRGDQQAGPAKQRHDETELVVATIDLDKSDTENAALLEAPSGDLSGDRGELLASMAAELIKNAHQANGAKMKKAKGIIAKIKSKVAQLPQLIEKNLQAKSSLGKAYIDHPSGPQEHPGPKLVYGRVPYPGPADKQQQSHQQQQPQLQQQQQQKQKQNPSVAPVLPVINQALNDDFGAPVNQPQNPSPGLPNNNNNNTLIPQQDTLSPQTLLGE